MICGSNDSSLRRDLGGDYLSENLKLWQILALWGAHTGIESGQSYRNSKTKETCPFYWPLDETRTQGSKEKIQWRLKQLCRLGGKWEHRRLMATNKQWAVGVKIPALLFSSLFCPCHIVHCLPTLCSWCLDRDKQIKPTPGFLEDLTQLRKQDLHPPKGEKAGLWAQSRNRFCCWLSRILQQNFQQCCQVRLLWDIACCLKKERKWQWLYVKRGRDIATLLFIYSAP